MITHQKRSLFAKFMGTDPVLQDGQLTAQMRQKLAVIARVTGFGQAQSLALLHRSEKENKRFYNQRDVLANNPAACAEAVAQIQSNQLEALQRVVPHLHSPLLIGAMHVRDYLPGLLKLAEAFPAGSQFTLYKREADNSSERLFEHLSAQSKRYRIVRPSDHRYPALLLAEALRRKEIVVMMLDVPSSFDVKRTARTEILGQPAQLARGPVELARFTDAQILPVGISKQQLIFGELIAGKDSSALTAIARFVGGQISNHYEDWLLWGHADGLWTSDAQALTI